MTTSVYFLHSVFLLTADEHMLTCSDSPSRVEGHVVSRSLRLKKNVLMHKVPRTNLKLVL